MSDDKMDRRDLLDAAFEQAEEGTLEAPIEKDIESNEAEGPSDRDEKGRFVSKDEQVEEQKEEVEASAQESYEEEAPEPAKVTRPSTWKKEYVQIWDKMEAGEQISKEDFTKFAEYANQRESEYKKGVSTYKMEADYAKELRDAIAPYEPELQRRNIQAPQYIAALAKADQILTHAPYDQKIQVLQQLAQAYGVNLNGNQAAPADAYTQQLMSQLNRVNQEVGVIKNRYEQEENARLSGEIQKFSSDTENYPYFEMVREEMAQLLERGQAQDLKSAYTKAVRLNDEIWAKEQDRLLNHARSNQSKSQQVAKAKAAAVSPRSVTPSGIGETIDAKDRRSLLSKLVAENNGGRV